MEVMNQYDERFGDSPARGINEPVPMMNIWGRPIRTEADVIEIYKRSLEEGKPWEKYIRSEAPEGAIQ